MINVLKSKTRNGAILNAVYHACDDYPGADFLHSKSAPDRSQISQMCFSLQSPPASLLHSHSSFISFLSFLKARRSSCAYHSQVRGRLLLRLLLPLLASRLLSHFLSLPLCILSLSLFFSSSFFFFFHFHSSVSYALRSNISSPGTRAPIVKRHPSDSGG